MGLFDNQLFCIILWAVIFAIALVAELATTELVSIWFCGGSVVSVIFAAVGLPFWSQLLVWVIVSAILLVIGRVFIAKKLKTGTVGTNTDALIGEKILITKTVTETTNGAGKFRDIEWTVVASCRIEAGSYAVVKEIQGNKLIVEKTEEQTEFN